MLHVYENGIRVGITRAIEYYAEAANKYMNNFGLSKSSLLTVYIDFDNQYENALSELIKYRGFK